MKFVSNAGTDRVLDLVRPWLKADNGLDMVSPKLSLFAFAEVLGDAAKLANARVVLLLKLGLDLCVPIEGRPIAGKTVHSIVGGVLMACLEPRIAVSEAEALALGIAAWRKEQAPAGDTTAVFRDSAFENDVAKSNLAAILQQHGIGQVRSL